MFMFFHTLFCFIFVFIFSILAISVCLAHLRLELGLCLLGVSTIHSKTDLAMLLTRFFSKWQLCLPFAVLGCFFFSKIEKFVYICTGRLYAQRIRDGFY